MRHRFFGRGSWLLVALVLALSAMPARGQLRFLDAPGEHTVDGVDVILRRASQLEEERRWGEALSVYEEALREHPGERTLADRQSVAKIHYDLSRRYTDSSYLRALQSLSEQQALSLYAEVLVKIESHYVAAPDWKALVDRGTRGVAVAVHEPEFRRLNLRGREDLLEALLARLRRVTESQSPATRQQAVDAVAAAVHVANQLQVSGSSVALEYACGAIGALDSYSSYLTRDQLNDVYSQIEGNFVGLGIELKAHHGLLEIVKVITGSPADRAGIRGGDLISEVDGQSTHDLTTDQAADLLQGEEGSLVRIAVETPRTDRVRRLTVRREHVEVPSVDDVRIVDRDYGVGYLKLTCFQKTTSRDLDAALWKLHREGMRSLVMDLRDNPGGLLTSSVEVADKFVENGVIVSTRGRSPLEDFNYSAHKAGTWRVPLVVLINGESASASEIFAGAIKDHRRGDVVGQRSYGKGSVQGIFPLSVAGAGVRLTTAKFYSPSGRPISNAGVEPSLVVHETARPIEGELTAVADRGGDPVLDAGVQAARRQTAKR